MKLPALLIAIFVAAGVLAASPIAAYVKFGVDLSLGIGLGSMLAGFGLLKLRRADLAWTAGLLAWFFLGAGVAQIERRAIPANQVTNLAGSGQLDLDEPLRWRGILREDPLRLPWGIRYQIDLEEVQTAGEWRGAHGGLRVTYFFDGRVPGNPAPFVPANASKSWLGRNSCEILAIPEPLIIAGHSSNKGSTSPQHCGIRL